jgi:hypothetical protein
MILMSRIAHELLGQLGKSETKWTPSIIPSRLMREIIQSLEGNVINGKLAGLLTNLKLMNRNNRKIHHSTYHRQTLSRCDPCQYLERIRSRYFPDRRS